MRKGKAWPLFVSSLGKSLGEVSSVSRHQCQVELKKNREVVVCDSQTLREDFWETKWGLAQEILRSQ